MWVLRSTWQVIFCEKWIFCISLLIIYTYSCIIVYLRISSCAVIHHDNWFTFACSDRTSLSSLPENSGLHPHTQMAPHGSLPLGSWKSNDLSSTPCTKKNYFKPWARAMNHNAVEWSVAHAPVVGKHNWSHSTNNGEAFSIRKFGPAKTTQNTERFELCLHILHHSWSIRDYHQFHFRLPTEPAFFSVMQSRQTRAAAPPGR